MSQSRSAPLILYMHPLSSFCWKALIALYENETAFEATVVDLSSEQSRADYKKIWPIGKFPVLRDSGKDRLVPESTSIIEYLSLHYPGKTRLVPAEAEAAFQTRTTDRFYDLYIHDPMQRIVGDRLRPADKKDPLGVEQARSLMRIALGIAEKEMATRTWATGKDFSMADCAAAPALFYTNKVMPFGGERSNLTAYLDRLMARPSFARVLAEAEPYFKYFPQ